MGWVALIAVTALLADGGDANRLLDDGIRAYDAMELDAASAKLREARAVANDKQRARIDLWLAVVDLERGRDGAARKHMKNAFAQNPRLDVPAHLSPRVHALADELRPAAPAKVAPPPRPRPRRSAARAPAAAPAVPVPVPLPVVAAAPASTDAPASVTAASQGEPVPVIVPATPKEPPAAPTATTESAAAPPAPEDGAAPAATGSAAWSPFLVAGAGASAVAASALVGAVALGALAKGAEGEANASTRAVDATERYQEASTASMVANGLFVTSALAATAAGVCIGVWMSGTAAE